MRYVVMLESPFLDKTSCEGKFENLEEAKESCLDYLDETDFIKWEEVVEDGERQYHGRIFWNEDDEGDIKRDWYRIIDMEG